MRLRSWLIFLCLLGAAQTRNPKTNGTSEVPEKKPVKKKSPMLGAKNGTDETMGLTQMELELPVNEPVGTMEPLESNGTSEEDTSPTHILSEEIKPEAKAQKQTKYDYFVSFIESNGVDVLGLTYAKLMEIAPSLKMSKTTYHRCVKDYLNETDVAT